jgi:hypothetical protein
LLDERSDLRSNDIISGLVTGLFARPGITTRFMSVEIDEIGYFDGIIVTVRQFRYPLEFVLWISIFDIYPMSASPATWRAKHSSGRYQISKSTERTPTDSETVEQ